MMAKLKNVMDQRRAVMEDESDDEDDSKRTIGAINCTYTLNICSEDGLLENIYCMS